MFQVRPVIEFLSARAEEDEARADALLFPPVGYYDKTIWGDELRDLASRIMADVEVKRAIINLFNGNTALTEEHASADDYYWWALIDVIRLFVQPYAQHPDFKAEWLL